MSVEPERNMPQMNTGAGALGVMSSVLCVGVGNAAMMRSIKRSCASWL